MSDLFFFLPAFEPWTGIAKGNVCASGSVR